MNASRKFGMAVPPEGRAKPPAESKPTPPAAGAKASADRRIGLVKRS